MGVSGSSPLSPSLFPGLRQAAAARRRYCCIALPESRYSRLERYAPLGRTLARWQGLKIAVVGLGGLGTALLAQLARFGAGSRAAGRLSLLDRDLVAPENLGHQLLYEESDAANALPKAEAAANAVRRINSAVRTQAVVAALTRRNIDALLSEAELIFDGLDNYYTRLLINDYALSRRIPFLHAGVVRAEMSALAVLPGRRGCLRCMLDQPPPAGQAPTCASEGVFGPLLPVAAAVQISLANGWIDHSAAEESRLLSLDAERWRWRELDLSALRPDCPACNGRFEYLDGTLDLLAGGACSEGRSEVELAAGLDLPSLQKKLQRANFQTALSVFALRAEQSDLRYTLFASGRVVQEGSDDPALLDRFVLTYLGL